MNIAKESWEFKLLLDAIALSTPLAEQRLVRLIATGLLLCLLVLLRRWYAYWAVAFFPALAVVQGLVAYQEHGLTWRPMVTIAHKGIMIGSSFVLALFGIATPFVLRVLTTDYSDIYSAYRFTSTVFEAAENISLHYGWLVIIGGIAGLIWLIVRTETRVLGTFLVTQSLIALYLFTQTQDFHQHHHYLLITAIALGIAALQVGIWREMKQRFLRIASIGIVFTALLTSFGVAFFPQAEGVSSFLANGFPVTATLWSEMTSPKLSA